MTSEGITVLVVLVIALVLFTTELLRMDLVAVMIIVALTVTGVLTPEESVMGFSNTATVTVGAMFMLSAALLKTGFVGHLIPRIADVLGSHKKIGLSMIMGVVAALSSVINNTPIVAIFIPVIIKASSKARVNAKKFLIPLSYASMFGGVCTLIGTSTNILVSGIAVQSGLQPLGMFQMTPLGLIFLITGVVYMMVIGDKLLPFKSYRESSVVDRFNMQTYLAEIVILPGSPFANKSLKDSRLIELLDLTIISVQRKDDLIEIPYENLVLRANDVVKIHCGLEKVRELHEEIGIGLSDLELRDKDISGENASLAEILVGRNPDLRGKTIQEIGFKNRFGGLVLAIKSHGEILHEKLSQVKLSPGDILLVKVPRERLEDFRKMELIGQLPFSVLTDLSLPRLQLRRLILVASVLLGMVLLASLGIVSIMVAAILGVLILIVTKCISAEEAYEAVDWKVIFLLAGAISLGMGMEKSGVALKISQIIIHHLGPWGPLAIMSALYLTTTLLTEIMSNNASAALLVPIAISMAQSLELSPVPFLMSVAFAASTSFMTPVGYQTNTMVYSAGQYRFSDFLKIGAPLNFIFWILATLIIPILYPF